MITRLFTPDITHALGWTLVHALWQGALFALLLGLTLILLRRYSAQARYLVATGLFAGFFLTTIFTFARLYTNAAQVPGQPITMQAERISVQEEQAEAFEPSFAEAEERETATSSASQLTLRERCIAYYNEHLPLIVTIWMMGVFVLLLRLIGQLAYVQRLGSYATATFPELWQSRIEELQMRMGIVRPVKSLLSARVQSPLTYGWLRPVLLLPAKVFHSLEDNQIYAILAHELAHIKRNDFLVNLLQQMMATLFFFHPGVWWMSARIQEEREHSCDDLAIQMTRHPVGYAKTLIQLEESQFYAPAVAMALKGKDKQGGTGFRQRINRLLSDSLGSGTFGEGVTTAFILVTVFLLAFVTTGQSFDQLAKSSPLSQKEQEPTSQGIPVFDEDPDYDMDFDMDADVRSPDETGGPVSSVPPISIRDTSKENMLYLFLEAIDDGNWRLVEYFLDRGVDVNGANGRGETPLMIAAGERHPNIVDLLMRRGADPNRTDKDGRNAADYAASEGDAKSLGDIIRKADAGTIDQSKILIEAAEEGHMDIVLDMVESLANKEGREALKAATGGREMDAGEYLAQGLMAASEEGHLNVAKFLVESGADVNHRMTMNGPTALVLAAEEGHDALVSYLIQQGADVSVTHDFKNLDDLPGNPFNSKRSGDRPVLSFFRGADALMTAVEEEHPECVDALLKAGADPNGGSAKTRFVDIGNGRSWQDIYQISLSEARGTYEPDYDVQGWTPLMEAVESNEERIVHLLLNAGAKVDTATNTGLTALTLARKLGYTRLVQILEDAR